MITLATLEEGVIQEIKMSHYSVAVGLTFYMSMQRLLCYGCGNLFLFFTCSRMQLVNTSQIYSLQYKTMVLEIVFWVTYNLNLNVVPNRSSNVLKVNLNLKQS